MPNFIENWLDRIIARLKRWNTQRYLRNNKVNPNEPCPSCGNEQGAMKYDPQLQKLVIQCQRCGAARCFNPLIPVRVWDFVGAEMKQQDSFKSNVGKYFDAGSNMKPGTIPTVSADTTQK
jgi:hypothetical protein